MNTKKSQTITRVAVIILSALLLIGKQPASGQSIINNPVITDGTNSQAMPATVAVIHDGTSFNAKTAIETAVGYLPAGGGKLEVSPGEFVFTTGAVLNGKSDIVIEGAGPSTIFKSSAAFIIKLDNCQNITLRNIKFVGDEMTDPNTQPTITHRGIFGNLGNKITFESCSFYGFFMGAANLEFTNNVTVRNCRFVNVGCFPASGAHYGAVHVTQGDGLSVIDSQFEGIKHSGVSVLYQTPNVLVCRNTMTFDPTSTHSMGIFAPQGIQGAIISQNRITGVHNEGIVLVSSNQYPQSIACNDNVITDNQISAKWQGITINTSANNTLAYGNIIKGNRITMIDHFTTEYSAGIMLYYAINTVISGNAISNGQTGVFTASYTNATTITGNSLRGLQIQGIKVAGAVVCKDNIISDSAIGIHYSHMANSLSNGAISENRIINVTTPLVQGTNVFPAHVEVYDNR